MTHITTEYGQPTNLITCTKQEFWTLKEFLNSIGVEIRMTSRCGDEITFQAQNGYKDWVKLHSSDDSVCQRIDKMVSDGIQSNRYMQ